MSDRFAQRLACESCGAATVSITEGILTCDFCSSQYYIKELAPANEAAEEYTRDRDRRERRWNTSRHNNPYYVNGGVSYRGAMTVSWLEKD